MVFGLKFKKKKSAFREAKEKIWNKEKDSLTLAVFDLKKKAELIGGDKFKSFNDGIFAKFRSMSKFLKDENCTPDVFENEHISTLKKLIEDGI